MWIVSQIPQQLTRPRVQRASSPFEKLDQLVEHRLISWFDRWLVQEHSRPKQAAFCVVACAGILGFRFFLKDWLRGGLPFVLITPMVTFCALRMGWSGGALAVVSALLYFVIEPQHPPGLYGNVLVVQVLFVLSGTLNVFVCSRCRIALLEVKRQREELQIRSRVQVALALKSASLGGSTASMRHEVNQPLAAAKTYAQAGTRWLARDPPNLDECRAALLRVAEAADQANGILKRFGGEAAIMLHDRTSIIIEEVVSDAAAFIRPQAEANDVSLTLALHDCGSTVLGDRVMLQQVFSNLLGNGVQACGERRSGLREVHVSCRREPGAVLVSIEDTGTGFPDADLEQNFTAFYTTKANGMGLGLPISRMTIEAHNGSLTIGNRPKVPGAFALVRLPTT